MEQSSCKSCRAILYGEYCSVCGQKVQPRFTFRYLWNLLHQDLLDVDHGLWHTVKDLTLRPGITIRKYLNGETKNYYSPVKYLIVVTALIYLLFLISRATGIEKQGPDVVGWFNYLISPSIQAFSWVLWTETFRLVEFIIPDYLVTYFLATLPFAALLGNILFKKWNFTELLIALMYLWAHLLVLLLGVTPLAILPLILSESSFSIGWMTLIYAIVFLSYFFITLRQLIEERWIPLIIKTIGMLYGGIFVSYLLLWIIISIYKLFIN